MYFRDLTPYRYRAELGGKGMLNVGWLGRGFLPTGLLGPLGFPRGDASEAMLDALFAHCRHPVERLRGIHDCGSCGSRPSGLMPVTRAGVTLQTGCAEIRVVSRKGVVYAAPELIYHYVAEHRYRPPTEFVEALLEGPRAGSKEHRRAIVGLGTPAFGSILAVLQLIDEVIAVLNREGGDQFVSAFRAMEEVAGDPSQELAQVKRELLSWFRHMQQGRHPFGDFAIRRADFAERVEANREYQGVLDSLEAALSDD